MSDIEIAQKAHKLPITDLAQSAYGIQPEHLESYGRYKAKLSLDFIRELEEREDGKLILVSAISPTPAGEGKTTTTVGLGDAMNRVGRNTIICPARTFSGPVLRHQRRRGRRRLCAGGTDGRHQPAFYRRFSRHRRRAQPAGGNARQSYQPWRRAGPRSSTDRLEPRRRHERSRVAQYRRRSRRQRQRHSAPGQLRHHRGIGRSWASFCLATSIEDLKTRLGRIIVGYTRGDRRPVTAADLKAHGAMAALLKDAIKPNLVQTLENNLAFIHGGPFANIAHGCNSVWPPRRH